MKKLLLLIIITMTSFYGFGQVTSLPVLESFQPFPCPIINFTSYKIWTDSVKALCDANQALAIVQPYANRFIIDNIVLRYNDYNATSTTTVEINGLLKFMNTDPVKTSFNPVVSNWTHTVTYKGTDSVIISISNTGGCSTGNKIVVAQVNLKAGHKYELIAYPGIQFYNGSWQHYYDVPALSNNQVYTIHVGFTARDSTQIISMIQNFTCVDAPGHPCYNRPVLSAVKAQISSVVPGLPSGMTTTRSTDGTQIKIKWMPGSNATSYDLQIRKSTAVVWGVPMRHTINLFYNFRTLDPLLNYNFRIRSVNGTTFSAWSSPF